jgi:hypothetical protein
MRDEETGALTRLRHLHQDAESIADPEAALSAHLMANWLACSRLRPAMLGSPGCGFKSRRPDW